MILLTDGLLVLIARCGWDGVWNLRCVDREIVRDIRLGNVPYQLVLFIDQRR